jgi:ABC-2 type transport system permease protein
MWPLRVAASKLRPLNSAAFIRVFIAVTVFAAFLWGDFVLFRRMFRATASVEAATPFFALAILQNLLSLVFLVATVVLFSSALTAAIGAFFTDLDLDIYHVAPRSKTRIVFGRWGKTLAQSATIVFAFLAPLFFAFGMQYQRHPLFYAAALANLALLLTIPVSLASVVIILLVRWFPVRRVHQIVATLAVLVLTLTVVAFRMSRPERLFSDIRTDDLVSVLRAIELPSMDLYPGSALAEFMVSGESVAFPARILVMALVSFAVFALAGVPSYFRAFVRARESMAPVAVGAGAVTQSFDRLFARMNPATRGMLAKEVRVVTRDVAQWSQVFMMVALLFIYLYNIRMLPMAGDARAPIVAYANLGMAGFVVAAVCLRFAYPSLSSEGKAFWLIQVAPVSYRRLLRVKVLVYAAPLTFVALLLTTFANVILRARPMVWLFTMIGAALLAITLVSLAVAMGAFRPDFNAENPLQVGLSLGGFAYMAVSLTYVAVIMIVMARPLMSYFLWRMFGVGVDRPWIATGVPLAIALVTSLALSTIPLSIAEKRLARLSQSG